MKKSHKILVILLSLAFIVSAVWLLIEWDNSGRMQDDHLRGVLEKGSRYKVDRDWYKTHPIARGDLVLYRYSSNKKPVVKIAAAVPGDSFHLVANKQMKNWNIEINDTILREVCTGNAEDDSCPLYFFGGKAPPTLSLYEKSHHGMLSENEVILFSSVSPGYQDSGVFGLVNAQDILGKVELPSNETSTASAAKD